MGESMNSGMGSVSLIVLCIGLGCSTTSGEGGASQAVRDGGSGGEADETICTLEADGTCSSSSSRECCPQRGLPYDFEAHCLHSVETVYCAPNPYDTACGAGQANGCGATPDGMKAWSMAGGLWQGMEQGGYVTCEEAELTLTMSSIAEVPLCTD
jgi:hypothetical protein